MAVHSGAVAVVDDEEGGFEIVVESKAQKGKITAKAVSGDSCQGPSVLKPPVRRLPRLSLNTEY
jgi:hypothetical protein